MRQDRDILRILDLENCTLGDSFYAVIKAIHKESAWKEDECTLEGTIIKISEFKRPIISVSIYERKEWFSIGGILIDKKYDGNGCLIIDFFSLGAKIRELNEKEKRRLIVHLL